MQRSLLAALIVSMAWLLALPAVAKISNEDLSRDPAVQTEQIKQLVDQVFADHPRYIRQTVKLILDCESGGKNRRGGPNGLITHVDRNGQVVTNKSSGAIGAGQIIPRFHSKDFRDRNKLNPENIYENLLYTKALIEDKIDDGKEDIFIDWKASESCRNKAS